MKQSHYTTPRTLNDATFWPGGAAIETPYRRSSWLANFLWAVACVAGCAVIGALMAQAV